MEGDFLTKGIHINVFDDEKDDIKGLRHKRKEIFSSGERRRKEGKTSNKEMLDKIVSIWSDSMSQRTTTLRAREERYKGKTSQASQATSPISDPYSAKACMELLDNMQDVPTSAYFKLMEKFTNMSLNSSDDSSSIIDSELDDYDDLMDLVLVMTIMEYEQSFVDKTPCRTSMLTEKMYTIEFLVGHETRYYENFQMKKDVFMNFCETLKEVGNLCDGKKVSIEEAIAMFLIIICHNLRHRVVVERFQHSLHTVSKWFQIILKVVCKLGTGIIHQRNQTNCIGAIDGTHVSAWAPTSKQTAFRGRKVLVTQNVLAVCDFDMLFTFVYSVDMDDQWLSVEQQGVNKNQAAEMTQVRQTITNEM
ncbi:hypothetical protein D0Y65_023487 [Glycine soja]|uniref:DUF8040 domain-containing protein n=1 Tax=Glycine soja TaxID=3848 RepID=A0A445IYE5_GLYSO|nr:hypothetical protein D0Y65_023487 [Glycine soja]